jgi:hypothetical protein
MLYNDPLRLPPFHFVADPDPTFDSDADPDLDTDLTSQNDADPDPQHCHNLRKKPCLVMVFSGYHCSAHIYTKKFTSYCVLPIYRQK